LAVGGVFCLFVLALVWFGLVGAVGVFGGGFFFFVPSLCVVGCGGFLFFSFLHVCVCGGFGWVVLGPCFFCFFVGFFLWLEGLFLYF